MKLIYLWIHNYGIFCNKGFNFSAKYQFSFDHKTRILSGRCNDEFPSIFYDSNVELISYIVGDNGAGKTSLFNLLMTVLPYDGGIGSSDSFSAIYILESSEGKLCSYTTMAQVYMEMHKEQKVSIHKLEPNNRNFISLDIMKHTSVIFHSNILDKTRYNVQDYYPGVEDISFNGLLRSDMDYRIVDCEKSPKTELRISLDADMIRQINFISSNINQDFGKWIPFSLPKRLYLYFQSEDSMLGSIYKYKGQKKKTILMEE